MKKLICLLCLAMVFTLSGCGKEEETNTDTDVKVTINENSVYTAPNKPTDAQIEMYNALGDAINEGTEKDVAMEVAKNFVADFYTLKNKTNSEDIGGLTYIPEDKRADFATYASIYAYANYEKIVQDYGKKNLPAVKSVEVEDASATTYAYTVVIPADYTAGTAEQRVVKDLSGFEVTVNVTFAKTKVSSDELPSTLTLTVVNLDGIYRVVEMI